MGKLRFLFLLTGYIVYLHALFTIFNEYYSKLFRPISEKLEYQCIKSVSKIQNVLNVRKEESLKTPLKTKYGSIGIVDATFIALPQQGNADQTKATT